MSLMGIGSLLGAGTGLGSRVIIQVRGPESVVSEQELTASDGLSEKLE